jgi:hypothetical protein
MSTLPKTFDEDARETLRQWGDAMATEGTCWIPGTTKLGSALRQIPAKTA